MKQTTPVKVLIGPSSFDANGCAALTRLKVEGYKIIENPFKRRLTKAEVIALLSKDVIGLIAGLEPLDNEVLENSNLKVISRCGSGLSNIDLDAAKKLGIKVYSTPSSPVTAVAELTVGAIIGLLRMIPQINNEMHAGKWTKLMGVQLEGKTIVIIGFGRIGSKVASLLEHFNARIVAVDPHIHGKDADGIEILPLDKALVLADIITIHCSGEEQIIGENEFKLIKQGAFLLNVARGNLVNEDALIRALDSGRIKGAYIDTFNVEPYSGRLIKYPQVILTPHIGSYTAECRMAMEMEAVENLISGLKRG